MKILTNTNKNSYSFSQKTSFNGLRQIINPKNTDAFFKQTKKLGEIEILKKTYENGKQKFTPIKVSVVEFILGKKDKAEAKTLYSLFENDYIKSKDLNSLDTKELGLVEFKIKKPTNIKYLGISKEQDRSLEAVKKAYNNTALMILHLISYEGDKYKGIGTNLLNLVVKKSKDIKQNGKVFLYARNSFDPSYYKNSKYCKIQENSVPTLFYYNYGFRADKKTNDLLENFIKNKKNNNEKPIDGIAMFLPEHKAKEILNK